MLLPTSALPNVVLGPYHPFVFFCMFYRVFRMYGWKCYFKDSDWKSFQRRTCVLRRSSESPCITQLVGGRSGTPVYTSTITPVTTALHEVIKPVFLLHSWRNTSIPNVLYFYLIATGLILQSKYDHLLYQKKI